MKSILKAISAVALTGVMVLPVLADDTSSDSTTDGKDQKDLKKVIEDQGINYVETAQKGITLSGYVDTSYTEQFGGRNTQVNSYGPTTISNNSPLATGTGATGPFGSGQAQLRQFDLHNDNFNINAVKIALEKALPDKNDWAAGFRIDTIYGQDAQVLNAADPSLGSGSGSSSFYLEQALVKFRIPVGNGLDIYAGKFVTFLGYEVIESPANPNFSRGLLFTNAIPLTNTGVYADYKFNDTFEAKLGIVDGWNTNVSPTDFVNGGGATDRTASDETFGGKAITGQLNVNAPGKNANLTFSFIYSPQQEQGIARPYNYFAPYNGSISGDGQPLNGGGSTSAGMFVLDLWGNWTPTFDKNGNTTLGFNLDFGDDSYTWYGAALYAQYKLTKVVTLAARGEYLHQDPGAGKFGEGGYFQKSGSETPYENSTTGQFYSFVPESEDDFSETLTASFAVWDNLLTRVEWRLDDLDGATVGTGHTQIQNEVSAEAVYSF